MAEETYRADITRIRSRALLGEAGTDDSVTLNVEDDETVFSTGEEWCAG